MSEIGLRQNTTHYKVGSKHTASRQDTSAASKPETKKNAVSKQAETVKPYVSIDTTKVDSVKFEIKSDPNNKNVESISFVDEKNVAIKEKPEEKSDIKQVIRDITNIGPVKIDDISVPTPIKLPEQEQKAQPLTPPPIKNAVSVKLKVKF